MANFDTPETTDVDVETLMGMIRRRVHGLPDARYIMGEIERVRLKAEGIATGRVGEIAQDGEINGDAPTRTRLGWKREMKGRVATLIMRAVRRNFRLQEVFNNSVVGVLQLMAEDLYAYERRLDLTKQVGAHESAVFDRAAFEQQHLDAKPFCRQSLSLFREMLREDEVALVPFCGRGELLATFKENSIEAVGLDPDSTMVRICRERGLSASQADVFEHLHETPDGSYGGIFAWRVVERLTNEQTAELLKLIRKKLKRGGIFVASATNIDHLAAMSRFYLDPSLVRPVPAKLLAFMIQQSGLDIHHFIFFGGNDQQRSEELSTPSLTNEIYPYFEYTIVAIND